MMIFLPLWVTADAAHVKISDKNELQIAYMETCSKYSML